MHSVIISGATEVGEASRLGEGPRIIFFNTHDLTGLRDHNRETAIYIEVIDVGTCFTRRFQHAFKSELHGPGTSNFFAF